MSVDRAAVDTVYALDAFRLTAVLANLLFVENILRFEMPEVGLLTPTFFSMKTRVRAGQRQYSPSAPGSPDGPAAPGTPSAPGGPGRPGSPAGPGGPCGASSDSAPSDPASPGSPGGP